MKQKLTTEERNYYSFTVIIVDFNILLSIMDKTTKQK